MLLLDSQENYKAAVSSSFQSSASTFSNHTHKSKHNSSFLKSNLSGFYQEFQSNHNRTKQTAKLLFNFFFFDLPSSILGFATRLIEHIGAFLHESSFNLNILVVLISLLTLILAAIALSWRIFSSHISKFNFQEFHSRKGIVFLS